MAKMSSVDNKPKKKKRVRQVETAYHFLLNSKDTKKKNQLHIPSHKDTLFYSNTLSIAVYAGVVGVCAALIVNEKEKKEKWEKA